MFAPSDDYHQLHTGVHRIEPKPLDAPALTWHLAFWIRKVHEDAKKTHDEVKKQLDKFILALCSSMKFDGQKEVSHIKLEPCISDKLLLFSTVADRSSFIDLGRVVCTNREEDILLNSSRYVLVKFVWKGIRISIRIELHTEYFSITTFAESIRKRAPFSQLQDFEDAISSVRKYFDGEARTDIRRLRQYLFRDFWQLYFDDILSHPKLTLMYNSTQDGNIFRDAIITDFRGIILSEEAVKFDDYEFFFNDGKNNSPSWGSAAKKQFLPLLAVKHTGRERPYECAINYVLDGRGLYMSALGPQLPEGPVGQYNPLDYILYVHQRDPYDAEKIIVNSLQLGRLVNHIHLLGTLRVAALKDAEALHKTGYDLRILSSRIRLARNDVDSNSFRASKSVRGVHDHFDDFTSKFYGSARCDLQYRIERSRYYSELWRLNLKSLRIKRLEGDQPYDQFVERRVGAVFNFIDRLGRRYERSINEIIMLDQDEISREVWDFQSFGEAALLFILAPYYASNIVLHIWPENYSLSVTLGIWVAFVGYAIWRRMEKRHMGTEKKRSFLMACGAALLWAAIWYLPVQFYFAPETKTEQFELQKKQDEAQKPLREQRTKQDELLTQLLREEIELLREQLDLQKKRIDTEKADQDRKIPPTPKVRNHSDH
jgi:hypothetical protein